MNYLLNTIIAKIPSPIRWAIGIALVGILIFFLWYKGTQLWNGIGNMYFAARMSWQGRNLKKDLDSAAAEKKELEQTFIELAKSKEALAAAQKEREIRDQIFNDKNKTAKEKVAAFEAAVSAAPVHTDPTGVSTDDLCERAKRIGGSQATIDALCSR